MFRDTNNFEYCTGAQTRPNLIFFFACSRWNWTNFLIIFGVVFFLLFFYLGFVGIIIT